MTLKTSEAVGRASGKVILLGEHAVVHGSYALALGIKRGVRISARESSGALSLSVRNWDRCFKVDDGTREGQALEKLVRALGIEPDGISLEALFEIPTRAGLGSSAALSAAAARAIVSLRKIEATQERLFEAVQAAERVFHGNPSGLDAKAALQGGVLLFSRSQGVRPVDAAAPPLLVVHSGQEGDTHETVARFTARLKESGKEGASRLSRISSLVERGVTALKQGDLKTLGQLMNENQEQLSWFGVSTTTLDRISRLALEAGALGAKLTGGGGGGCAVVLTEPGDTSVVRQLASAGFKSVDI
ncbi:MAG: mevalonate kinase [Proteobacteria bacterium]|nr:mevalonate kinase [Pseudomonadota bacterium]